MARYRKDPRDQHFPKEEPYPTSRPRALARQVAVETAEAVAERAARQVAVHLGPVRVECVEDSHRSLPNGTQLCQVEVYSAGRLIFRSDGHEVG